MIASMQLAKRVCWPEIPIPFTLVNGSSVAWARVNFSGMSSTLRALDLPSRGRKTVVSRRIEISSFVSPRILERVPLLRLAVWTIMFLVGEKLPASLF